MRRFGRQCCGQGKVLLRLVRDMEARLLEVGQPIVVLAQAAQASLASAMHLDDTRRQRLAMALSEALDAYEHIAKQSRRLIHGKKLGHCKIVNAYDPTIAPILKGKSNCPAQFGRKPGLLSEPTAGFIFATHTPLGNPIDASYVLPLVDKVQNALKRVKTSPPLAIHSVAGDLGVNDLTVRQVLHERGILTIGIPKTTQPINPHPTPQEVLDLLNGAGLNRKRTPYQVQLACACGYSRPVVESHIASLLCRGAGELRYKGPQGAVVQLGMTAMASNGAEGSSFLSLIAASNASSVEFWVDDESTLASGPELDDFYNAVAAAAYSGEQITHVVWSQGESDASRIANGTITKAQYKADLEWLFE